MQDLAAIHIPMLSTIIQANCTHHRLYLEREGLLLMGFERTHRTPGQLHQLHHLFLTQCHIPIIPLKEVNVNRKIILMKCPRPVSEASDLVQKPVAGVVEIRLSILDAQAVILPLDSCNVVHARAQAVRNGAKARVAKKIYVMHAACVILAQRRRRRVYLPKDEEEIL
jgi:hypothetical protein